MASFPIPTVFVNDSGWGPEETNVPDKFRDVPFAPFGKGDRLGRAADFTASAYSARYQVTSSTKGGPCSPGAAVTPDPCPARPSPPTAAPSVMVPTRPVLSSV